MSSPCSAASTASEIAMPRLPGLSGCSARMPRPASVRSLRARVQRRAVDLHHGAARRLLVVRRAHLPDLALHAVLRGGERERRAPLAGAGLGGELPDAFLVVVVGLRHRGVRLVAAGRADALVLEEDLRRGVEQLLQPPRPHQRATGARSCRRRCTPPGMSTYCSVVTSCSISAIGNSGARSSGPTGSRVPGCSGGGGGSGRSGTMLYHCVGIWVSSSRNVERSVAMRSILAITGRLRHGHLSPTTTVAEV